MWDYGDDNRGPELAAVAIAMTAISMLAVGLRSYTMGTILKRFLFEDWLAVFTCLLQIGFCVIVVMGVSYGLGAHVDHVPEQNRHVALIFKWAGQVAYIVVSTLVKFVVGIFLMRLCVNNNWQRITIVVLLVVVGLFNVFYVFIAVFQCQPIEFYWYRYTEDSPVTGKCNGHSLATIPTYFAVLIGIVADLTLALLPATLIKGANLDQRTKISVCCVLALGSLASVATIARIPYARQLLSDPDYLHNFTDLAIWSIVECGIAIAASSLATLRPLFIKMKLLATSHFTARGYHSKAGSVLPIQSANHTILISSRSRDAKRNTFMTGTTSMTGTTAHTMGSVPLMSVKEGRDVIQVEKEFEMSVITREASEDSIDRLEAEAEEIIRPGTAKLKANQDRISTFARSSTIGGRPRQTQKPLQTSLQVPATTLPAMTTTTISAGSSHSLSRFVTLPDTVPSTPRLAKRLSNGFAYESPGEPSRSQPQTPRTSIYGGIGSAYTNTHAQPTPDSYNHHRANSDSSASSPMTTGLASPPSFHLPRRFHSHQSTASNVSMMSAYNQRGTFTGATGLSAPPRMLQTSFGQYTPKNHDSSSYQPQATPTYHSPGGAHGSPNSRSSRSFANSITHHSGGIPKETTGVGRKGTQRVSAFMAYQPPLGADERQGNNIQDEGEAHWTQSQQHSSPRPLRSHPPLSPRENWV